MKMAFRNTAANITSFQQLTALIEYHFSKRYGTKQTNMLCKTLNQYFVHHNFDEWNDIVDDINSGYDYCCCKTVIFQQLNVSHKEKHNVYKYLQQSLRTCPLPEIYTNILTIFTNIMDPKTAKHILKAFKFIIDQKQWKHIADIMHDIKKEKKSAIIVYILDEIKANNEIISNGITSIVMGQKNTLKLKLNPFKTNPHRDKDKDFIDRLIDKMRTAFKNIFNTNISNNIVRIFYNHIKEEDFNTIDRIKDDLEDIHNSGLFNVLFTGIHDSMSDKSNYKQIISQKINNITADILGERRRFNIKNFVFATFRNTDYEIKENRSVIIAREVEQLNDFPLLWWFVDAFSRDRVDLHKTAQSHDQNVITLEQWCNNCAYFEFIRSINSTLAMHIKSAVAVLIKRALPSLDFRPSMHPSMHPYIIKDSLNAFARYTLFFHTFTHTITELMRCHSDRYQCAPLQFALMIIPRAMESPEQRWSCNETQKRDPPLLRIQSKDCYIGDVEQDFCAQLLNIWNDEKRGLYKKRHKQYICIVDRRRETDGVYFIVSKDKYALHHQQSIHLSSLKPNVTEIVDGTIRFCLSYHVLTQNNTKGYVHINYGGHKFALSDMDWLWPRFFNKTDGEYQCLSEEIMEEIKECNMNNRLRDDDFDEFVKQNKDLTLNNQRMKPVLRSTCSALGTIAQSVIEHFVSMAMNPENIRRFICNQITQHFNPPTPTQIIQDLSDPNSEILNKIFGFKMVRDQLIDEYSINMIRKNIQSDIKAIIGGTGGDKKYFVITDFEFNVGKTEITQAANTMRTHCPIIFSHAEYNEMAQDLCLCKGKAIDIKNGVPLMLWLLDMFCRDKVEKHIKNMRHNIHWSKDDAVINYNIARWWYQENVYTQWIVRHYPQIENEMVQALGCLIKRALPHLNFSPVMAPVINDSLNAFVKYTLAIHNMITSVINNELYNVFPIQFDFWIIPQSVKTQTFKLPYDDDDDDDMEDYKEDVIHYMSKQGQNSAIPQNSFWNLEDYLKESGYQRDNDYFVRECCDKVAMLELKRELYRMWSEDAVKYTDHRFRRYIFVIDRRNPINLQKRSMKYKTASIGASKDWNDKIYLIIPKERFMRYNKGKKKWNPNEYIAPDKITKKFYELNECMLGESKKYLIPHPFNKGDQGTVSALDCLNGYKFNLSFHLHQTNNCKCYWYIHGGGQYFTLQDIKCLWPRFFTEIDGTQQRIHSNHLDELNSSQILPNPKFDEFLKQVHNL